MWRGQSDIKPIAQLGVDGGNVTVCEHRQGAVDWFELVKVVSEVGCTSCRSRHTGHAGEVVTACQTTRTDWTRSKEGHDGRGHSQL